VYLKSLTMKGFKSFADPTTLDFEPGVTVVVGPNRLGQVERRRCDRMGARRARPLDRPGPRRWTMSSFAGTTDRAALGRAEVTLVIDNTSRRLPADLNEVTIPSDDLPQR